MKTPLPTGASPLPPLYAGWMEDLLQAPIPEEKEATCSNCPMCSSSTIRRTEKDSVFNSSTKCCTYIPKIPNFLAGRILADHVTDAAKGRQAFEAYFNQTAVIRPQGVFPDYTFTLRYSSEVFGTEADMRCPYYLHEEGGLCGIWRHRAAVCSTWFCKYVRGVVGRKFWKTLNELLAVVQVNLSYWCMHQLEVGSKDFRKLFHWSETPDLITNFERQIYLHQSLFGRLEDPAQFLEFRKREWGIWLNREKEFYQECARLVSPLSWADVTSILGQSIAQRISLTKEDFAQLLSDSLPSQLRPGKCITADLSETEVRVWGYALYDPIDLPKSILEVIPYFDGHSTEEVLQRILAETGKSLQPEMLRRLVDFGILQTP
jgi:hypothetical protein